MARGSPGQGRLPAHPDRRRSGRRRPLHADRARPPARADHRPVEPARRRRSAGRPGGALDRGDPRPARRGVGEVAGLDELNERRIVPRYRELKHRLDRYLFHPKILVELLETNLAFKNVIRQLYSVEERRITAEYQRVFDLEREVVVDADLEDELQRSAPRSRPSSAGSRRTRSSWTSWRGCAARCGRSPRGCPSAAGSAGAGTLEGGPPPVEEDEPVPARRGPGRAAGAPVRGARRDRPGAGRPSASCSCRRSTRCGSSPGRWWPAVA